MKCIFSDAQEKLIIIINRWEINGNGFGQSDISDEKYGHLENEMLQYGDNRSNFLSNYHEHHLYGWYVLDESQMLMRVMSKLDDTFSATGESTSCSSIESNRKRKVDPSDIGISITEHMGNISKASLIQQLNNCRKSIAEYEVKALLAETDSEKAIWTQVAQKENESEVYIIKELHAIDHKQHIAGNAVQEIT